MDPRIGIFDTHKENPDGEMEEVIWKPIRNFEGLYEINQFGDIKSLSRFIPSTERRTKTKILCAHLDVNKSTYSIRLANDGKRIGVAISRLVAETFLGFDRSDTKRITAPKDGDRANMYYKNIDIVVLKEVRRTGASPKCKHRPSDAQSRRIRCENTKGDSYVHRSIVIAAKKFCVTTGTIWYWLRGDKYYRGWKWTYVD